MQSEMSAFKTKMIEIQLTDYGKIERENLPGKEKKNSK
jgi:hypothetical protein